MGLEARGTIVSIQHRPIKAGGAMSIERARVTPAGLETLEGIPDHGFMVVHRYPDAKGVHHFITQRDKRNKDDRTQGLADLGLIKPHIENGGLVVTWDGRDPIQVPIDNFQGEQIRVEIWDEVVYAIDQGSAINDWISQHLHHPVRLVRAQESSRRNKKNYFENNAPLGFQDGYSIHWLSIQSIEKLKKVARTKLLENPKTNDLAARVDEEIRSENFRPQIVVDWIAEGADFEHQVYRFGLSEVDLTNTKPCDRCPVTGVDPDTGGLNEIKPLAFLPSYKSWITNEWNIKPIFGENAIADRRGEIGIAENNEVVVYSHRAPPLVYGPREVMQALKNQMRPS